MKADFIEKFIEAVKNATDFVDNLMIRESLHYKDLRMAGFDPQKIYRGFKNLERRGLLKKDGSDYRFTQNGNKWFQRSAVRYFKLKNKKWDKKWRIIIFDIPQSIQGKRDWFRKKLVNLGFYMLQKSVFVFPYPCEDELGDICSRLEISDYVDFIVADSAGFQEKEIKKYFKL